MNDELYIFMKPACAEEIKLELDRAGVEIRRIDAARVVLKEDILVFQNEVSALAAWNECLRKTTGAQ